MSDGCGNAKASICGEATRIAVMETDANTFKAAAVSPPGPSISSASDTCNNTDESLASSLLSPAVHLPAFDAVTHASSAEFCAQTSSAAAFDGSELAAMYDQIPSSSQIGEVPGEVLTAPSTSASASSSVSGVVAIAVQKVTASPAASRSHRKKLKPKTFSSESNSRAIACQSDGEPLRPQPHVSIFSSNKPDKNKSYRERKRQKESLKCRCMYCAEILTLHAIKQHIERHTGCETTQFCQECSMSCGSREKLREHIRIVHLKDKPFRCDICNYKFSTKHNFDSHLKTQSHQLVLLGKKGPAPQRLGKQEPPAKTIDERKQLAKYAVITDGPEYVILPDSEQAAATDYHTQKKTSRSGIRKRCLDENLSEFFKEASLLSKSANVQVELFRENFCNFCNVFCGSRREYERHMQMVHDYKNSGVVTKICSNKRTRPRTIDGLDSPDSFNAGDAPPPQIMYWKKLDVSCTVPENWKPEDTLLTVYQRPQEALGLPESAGGGGDVEKTGITTLLHELERLLSVATSSTDKTTMLSGTIAKTIVHNKSVLNAKPCTGQCKLEEFVKVQARHIVELNKQLCDLRRASQQHAPDSQQSRTVQRITVLPTAASDQHSAVSMPSSHTTARLPSTDAAATTTELNSSSSKPSLYDFAHQTYNARHNIIIKPGNAMPLATQQSTVADYSAYAGQWSNLRRNGAGDSTVHKTEQWIYAPPLSVLDGTNMSLCNGGGQQQQILGPNLLSRLIDNGWKCHQVEIVDDEDEEA